METRIILISSKSTFAFPLIKVCCVVRGRSESLFIINSYHESYLPLAFIIPLWLPYRPVAPLLSLSNIPFLKRASCKSGLIRYSARYRKLSDYPPAVSINQPLFIPPFASIFIISPRYFPLSVCSFRGMDPDPPANLTTIVVDPNELRVNVWLSSMLLFLALFTIKIQLQSGRFVSLSTIFSLFF